MNIYIDATSLLRKPDGVGRYGSSVVSQLLARDHDNHYRALAFADDRPKFKAIPPAELKYEYLPLPRQIYNQWFKRIGQVSINRWLKKRPDVVIYPNFVNFPKIKNTKSIVVIHDLAYLEAPQTLTKRSLGKLEKVVPKSFVRPNLHYLEKFVPRALEQATAVVAVSEETRDAIAAQYGLNASDITVIPNAVDEKFFSRRSAEELQAVRVKYGLPDDFILFLGTIEPRKNIMNLLEGYASLPAKLREQYPLVLAGKKGWNSEGIDQRVQELLEEGNSILTTGFVDDEDLPALLKAANLLLWPSIHEGFGLPILEAMAAGTPVVTSDLAPMNRLGEDAALFVTPDKPVTITSAVRRVLESPKLAKEMTKKGKLVAKKHRWDNSAQAMLELINRLGNDD